MGINIKNIIFDLGGVLVHLDAQRCYKAMERIGVDNAEARLHSKEGMSLLVRLETGAIGEEEFYQSVRQYTGCRASDDELRWAWNQFLVKVEEEKKRRLLQLRLHYHVFLLSNTNVMHWNYCAQELFPLGSYGVDDYFDRVFLSYELHLSKPQPAIFEKTLQLAGIRADETLFIDDVKANCDAARGLGIHTWQNLHDNDWLNENDLFK
ncbi:MAG: HAD family hydrolase [Prevotella sp.]|jgi:putative hydrolase of the HAD superfamily